MVRVFIFFVRLSLQSNSCYTYSHPSDLLRLPAQSPRRRQVCRPCQSGALEVRDSFKDTVISGHAQKEST